MLHRFGIRNNGGIDMMPLYDCLREERLIKYNENLDGQMDLLQLNESVIDADLEELEPILSFCDPIEKYSLCRLTELALFCVGNYANNNCITEVGDFMINPRLILVHIKDEALPVVKERHTRLTEQFKDRACETCSAAQWLEFNTITEIVKKPILPYLIELLKKYDCSGEYMKSVRKRINSIIDLLGHFHMAGIPGEMNIEEWKSCLSQNDRIMMEALYYKFDPAVFNDLGEKIHCLGS